MQRCVSLNTKCKCYPSGGLQHSATVQDCSSPQLRHDNEMKGKRKGHNLYMWARLISLGDIKWRITVYAKAPETDSEGQTLQIIPLPSFFFLWCSQSPRQTEQGSRNRDIGAAVRLLLMCNERGRAIAISLPQSPSSCPDQGSSFKLSNMSRRSGSNVVVESNKVHLVKYCTEEGNIGLFTIITIIIRQLRLLRLRFSITNDGFI